MEWGRRQLADVFLVSFRAIETTSRQGSNSHWITLDRDDRWYNGLNVVVTNLVLEVVRLIVEAETVRVSAPEENNSAFTVQDELPRPFVTRLLHRYLTFDLNGPSFTAAVRGEVVVKKGTMSRPIPEDSSRPNLAVNYWKNQPFQLLAEPCLAVEQPDELSLAYGRRSTLGRAIQLCQDFQRELDRLLARTVAAHRYGRELDKELRKLDEEERSGRLAQEALGMYSDKTLQKEALVTERRAAVAGPRVAGPADISSKPHVASPAPDSSLMSHARNPDIDKAEQRRTEGDALELLDRPESMLSQ